MYITIIDCWRAEDAYSFINDYVTDADFLKAFPGITREEFLNDTDVLWDDGYSDWEVINAIVQHWDGYYTIFSDDYEHIVMQLRIPDCLDPNNISHYKRS